MDVKDVALSDVGMSLGGVGGGAVGLVSLFFTQRRRVSQSTQRDAGSLRACGQLLAPLSFEIFRFKRSKKDYALFASQSLPSAPLRSLREIKFLVLSARQSIYYLLSLSNLSLSLKTLSFLL